MLPTRSTLAPAVALAAVVVVALATPPALAGRGKIIEIKSVPKSVKSISEGLPKAKDPVKRSGMLLVLDDMLRAQPEVTDAAVYDQLAGVLFNDVLDRMAEPTDVFTMDASPDKFQPRADVFLRELVKVKPGRTSKQFTRRYTKRLQGKGIDRAYKAQPMTLDFATAQSEAEFSDWTETKGWGVVVHAAHVDGATGVARIGCTFLSGGTKEAPGSRFERPSWVGFYKQPKPGVGTFLLLALEPVTAVDWREQPINMVPPKVEGNELSKKLALLVWMEQVRGLPAREKLSPQEEALFGLQLDEPPPAAWVEGYRDSDSPLVRAAVEMKLAASGGNWRPDSIYLLTYMVKHPGVKAVLDEQLKKAPAGWKPPPLPPGLKIDVPDAGAKVDAGVKDGSGKDAGAAKAGDAGR